MGLAMFKFFRRCLLSFVWPMGGFSWCPWQIDGKPSGPLVARSAGAMYRLIDEGLRMVAVSVLIA